MGLFIGVPIALSCESFSMYMDVKILPRSGRGPTGRVHWPAASKEIDTPFGKMLCSSDSPNPQPETLKQKSVRCSRAG